MSTAVKQHAPAPGLALHAKIEKGLREYAEWRSAGPPDYSCGRSIFDRIREDHDNAGVRGSGFRPTIIDGVACRPDGGLGRLADRMGREIARDNRCREIHELLPFLPESLKPVFEATYIGLPREVPRREREAAGRLNLSLATYQKLKFGLICWFAGVKYRVYVVEGDSGGAE